jgi:thiol-disulfide isomerase/thioredoxin
MKSGFSWHVSVAVLFLLASACSRAPSPEKERSSSYGPRSKMERLTADNFRERLASSPQELVFINFWATWCVPCKEEFPDLVRVEKEHRGKGIVFWAVSCDAEDDLATTVPQFLAEQDSGLEDFCINLSEQEEIINAVSAEWPGSLPATFIFRRTGERIFEHIGKMSYEQSKSAVQQALGGGK